LIEEKHCNEGDVVHGGCLATFADMALFVIGSPELQGCANSVTVSLNLAFVNSAKNGEWIEARGEITRSTRRMLFLTGQILNPGAKKVVATFSGVVKKTPKSKL